MYMFVCDERVPSSTSLPHTVLLGILRPSPHINISYLELKGQISIIWAVPLLYICDEVCHHLTKLGDNEVLVLSGGCPF